MGLLDRLRGLVRTRGGAGGKSAQTAALLDPEGPVDDTRAAMLEQAGELLETWSDRPLDFTPASLPKLDRTVDARFENDRFRDAEIDLTGETDDETNAVYTGLVLRLGAYYGEVLIRAYGGEWIQDAEGNTLVSVGDDEAEVNVFHIAEDCLTEPSKLALNHDTLVGALDIDGPEVAEREGRMYVRGEPTVYEHSELDPDAWVETVEESAGAFTDEASAYELDYTPDSLVRLDLLVREEFAEFDFTDAELGGEDGDSVALTTHAVEIGGYTAVVFREALGAEWETDGETPRLRIAGADDDRTLDPVAHAQQCITGDASLVDTYERLAADLELDAPEIDEAAAMSVFDAGGLDAVLTAESEDALADTAEAFAASVDPDLDFTPASLADLDAVVGDTVDLRETETLKGVTAYLGETLCRNYDCEWSAGDDVGWLLVLPKAEEDTAVAMPMVTIVEQLREGETLAEVHDTAASVVDPDAPTLAA
jgi:hypothetical protein